MGNEGTFQDAKTIFFIAHIVPKSMKQNRLAEDSAYCLRLMLAVGFSSSCDNLLLSAHSLGDARDKVSNFCL